MEIKKGSKMKRGSRFDILSKGLRRTRGEMNRTESAYAELLRVDPTVHRFWFEPFSLRLSNPAAGRGAMYSPDFLVLMTDGVTFVDDVKSGGLDDNAAIVRIKTAAEAFPLWRFRLVSPRKKKDGGGFEWREV